MKLIERHQKHKQLYLEAMQERSVTIAGNHYNLDLPFFVLATQNPIEQEGTYPLPEAQLDRFMFSIILNIPAFEEEVTVVKNTTSDVQQESKCHTFSLMKLSIQQLITKNTCCR